jgi:tetratricopeptide (TPR) repeat protein
MRLRLLFLTAFLVVLSGCSRSPDNSARQAGADACAIALASHTGESKLDQEISRLQAEARTASNPSRALDQLGWRFVSKARISSDPGYYKLAEKCAECMQARSPRKPEALLLRGHVLHNVHRFKEAEEVARELLTLIESSPAYGLLGDALMEQGRLKEAAVAYQKMVDLKPSPQGYIRAAHMRWLKGDLGGAIEIMRMAAGSSTPRDPESAAWTYARLALYELQAGNIKGAQQAVEQALSFQEHYPAALLARGRVLLARGKPADAIEPLRRAARNNPLPEYQWALAEALHDAGRADEARTVEAQLAQQGGATDPRTFALFLTSRGQQVETAIRLAEKELTVRSDVFTLDTLAWSLAAAGKIEEARSSMERALAEGTKDARLFYHAGVIAASAGEKQKAREWLGKASEIRQMLLPSERQKLSQHLAAL